MKNYCSPPSRNSEIKLNKNKNFISRAPKQFQICLLDVAKDLESTSLTKNGADIKEYNVYRCDRSDNIKGGGVAINVCEKLKICQIWENRHKI